jgi:hypothetical protein
MSNHFGSFGDALPNVIPARDRREDVTSVKVQQAGYEKRRRIGRTKGDKLNQSPEGRTAAETRDLLFGGQSNVHQDDLKKQYKPISRRRAWLLARLLFIHLKEGHLVRVADVCNEAMIAHTKKTGDDGDATEVWITQLNELIGNALFNELMIETVQDLSTVRRSEIAELPNFGAEKLLWLENLLTAHGRWWTPETEEMRLTAEDAE